MPHFLKIALNIFNIRKYYYNIRDYLPHHPVASLNTFLMIAFYYGILFVHIGYLVEDRMCVYLIGVYPGTDFIIVIISLMAMRNVVRRKTLLE